LYQGGPIDGNIFANLDKIIYLNLRGNSFDGSTIPEEIWKLPNLKFFYASNADLTGRLDEMSWIDMPAIGMSIRSCL
jgi:hypothetical protein